MSRRQPVVNNSGTYLRRHVWTRHDEQGDPRRLERILHLGLVLRVGCARRLRDWS
jgi:hypothetical protein